MANGSSLEHQAWQGQRDSSFSAAVVISDSTLNSTEYKRVGKGSVLNANELRTFKWLIFCYVNFT